MASIEVGKNGGSSQLGTGCRLSVGPWELEDGFDWHFAAQMWNHTVASECKHGGG